MGRGLREARRRRRARRHRRPPPRPRRARRAHRLVGGPAHAHPGRVRRVPRRVRRRLGHPIRALPRPRADARRALPEPPAGAEPGGVRGQADRTTRPDGRLARGLRALRRAAGADRPRRGPVRRRRPFHPLEAAPPAVGLALDGIEAGLGRDLRCRVARARRAPEVPSRALGGSDRVLGMTMLQGRASELDEANPVRHCRERFLLPEGTTYLDGNSLGALPAAVPAAMQDAVHRQWGTGLIGSWFAEEAAWWELPQRLGDHMGTLLGAAPGQTVVGDSTSVQIFNTLTAAARLRPNRRVLLTDAGHFPTDAYLADSVGEMLGLEVRRVTPREL